MTLTPQQVQELPWATLDDQIDAMQQAQRLGYCIAKVVNVDGDVRLVSMSPPAKGRPS